MKSELFGRLRNTILPSNKGLMPVYEAVVNSIEAIEELNKITPKPLSNYHINVEVIREEQLGLALKTGPHPEGEIWGFKITDNGVGFTDENWNSFNTLDSLLKAEKGCRGIGRLMWLKAFNTATIDSNYYQDGKVKNRLFSFSVDKEVLEQAPRIVDEMPISTTVSLEGFKQQFAVASHKTLDKIAAGLLEHCLWYFIRSEDVPKIRVVDNDNIINLSELFVDHMDASTLKESVIIMEQHFEITHVKIRIARNKLHTLGYCASGRLVKEENLIGKIPGLYREISDGNGQFSYMAYLTGQYLDEKVTNERLNFNIYEKTEDLFVDTEISYSDIREAIYPLVKKFLADSLEEVLREGKERVEEFVSNKAPKYRPLLKHIPKERLVVDPGISEKELEMHLHKETFEIEQDILKEGHDLLQEVSSYDEYSAQLKRYLERVTDLKQSDLANYVAHRRVVIDLLNYAITRQTNGEFVREEVIHDLIVPMRVTSEDTEYHRQNLWLLDERLAFHHFLASDKSISSNPTTNSDSMKQPDIATMRVFENPLLFGEQRQQQASITVVEIKRPMRNDFVAGESVEKDPVRQSLNYLRRLREGACTVKGRPIPNADKIPGFIYILADFTEHLIDCCKMHQLQKTVDGMGYFGYHRDEDYNAYIQVISFDGLVESAKERNRAFFDQLGLPTR